MFADVPPFKSGEIEVDALGNIQGESIGEKCSAKFLRECKEKFRVATLRHAAITEDDGDGMARARRPIAAEWVASHVVPGNDDHWSMFAGEFLEALQESVMVRLVDASKDVILFLCGGFPPRMPDVIGRICEVRVTEEVEVVWGAVEIDDAAGVRGEEHFAMEGGRAICTEVAEAPALLFVERYARREFPEIGTAVVGRVEDGKGHGRVV